MECSLVRSTIGEGQADGQILRGGLGVLHLQIEETIVFKNAGVNELKFVLVSAAATVFVSQLLVGEALLGISIQRFGITPCGRPGQVIHHVFDVFTVIALRIAETKKALLQNVILSVPEHWGEAEQTLFVTDPEQAVFAPAVRAQMAVVEGK